MITTTVDGVEKKDENGKWVETNPSKSKGITIKVDVDVDEVKVKLNDIEQQLDRILDKQKRMTLSPNYMCGCERTVATVKTVEDEYDIDKLAEKLQYYMSTKARQTYGR